MDKVKLFAKIGIGLAILDILIRYFGPLYTAENHTGSYGALIIPVFAIIVSIFGIKAKKAALYLGIIFSLFSLVAFLGILRNGESGSAYMLPLLYFIIFGLLSFFGLQESKKFK